jgi:cysteine desulfurase/selenocysteine lyase
MVSGKMKADMPAQMDPAHMDTDHWDIERLRSDTAGSEQSIFFNNAGASLQPRPVVARVVEHLRLEEQVGGYEAEERVAGELQGLYGSVARLLNCAPEEIALQENATRAWEMAFYSLRFAPGDRIVTAANEYSSNYIAFLQVARRTGAEICVVESDPAGEIDLEALERLLDDRVKLIAITHVPTNGGLVQPAARVGELARRAEIPFLLDACQSTGQMQLDVNVLGCDMLCATGRKYLRGPRGTGFLYVRSSMLAQMEPPLLDNLAADWVTRGKFEVRRDARKFETFESSVAIRLGLGVAIEYALALGLEKIERRVQALAALLRARLTGMNGITVRDLGRVRCGIVTFTYEPHAAPAVVQWLRANGIVARTIVRSSTRIDMEQRNLEELVRTSVHYYNTEAELARLCEVLESMPRA